jgi:hypothetical protein
MDDIRLKLAEHSSQRKRGAKIETLVDCAKGSDRPEALVIRLDGMERGLGVRDEYPDIVTAPAQLFSKAGGDHFGPTRCGTIVVEEKDFHQKQPRTTFCVSLVQSCRWAEFVSLNGLA